MRLADNFLIAFRALRANKLRTFLTMLGIVVGVSSVIAMIAVGLGAQAKISEKIQNLGANLLSIRAGSANQGRVRLSPGTQRTLTTSDANAVAQLSSVVVAVAPIVRGKIQLVAGNRNVSTLTYGTVNDYFVAREWQLAGGRYFASSEQSNAAKVVILGQTTAETLFDGASPLGQQIRILNVPFTVIGLLTKKGSSASGRDQDDVVYVPLSTARIRLIGHSGSINHDAVDFVLVKVKTVELIEAAQVMIAKLLRRRHQLRSGTLDDFRISDPSAAMVTEREAARTFAWLLAAIASVSLAVGGISIMNIMLVSVTERTREIGVRLAVGANRQHIRNQFLIEAMTLCLLGGLIGLVLGCSIAVAIAHYTGWPIIIGLEAVVAAVGFSTLIGVFFGYYPARKAALQNPIEALHYE